jgi:SlyX protein
MSIDPDERTAALERRLTELEIKASYSEDLLDTLNAAIARQQQQIDALLRELLQQRQRTDDAGTPAFRSLRDEIPPHY